MADNAGPFKTASQAKKEPARHPKFIDMVIEGILAQNDRKGASLQAIKSYISDQYITVDPNMMKSNVRKALAKGLDSGVIVRPKSSEEAKGMTGRFKIDKVKHAALNKPKKPVRTATEKAAAKPKVKKAPSKDTVGGKSPKRLKTPKKITKSKTLKVDKGKSKEQVDKKPNAKKKSPAKAKATATATSTSKPKSKEKGAAAKAPKAKKKLDVPEKSVATKKPKTTTKKKAADS